MTSPITIIGSGLAGYTFAREFRKHDQDTALRIITADNGSFYSKPMLSNALTQKKTPDKLAMSDAKLMAEQLNAEIRPFSKVTHIDTDKQCYYVDDERLEYETLILASGAEQVPLPLAGTATNYIISVNDLSDYRRFRSKLDGAEQVAIMGAGLIGCEFANDLQQSGYEVILIDPATHLLSRLLPQTASVSLEAALRRLGVRFYFEHTVETVDHAKAGYQLTLSDGEKMEIDVLLSAGGLRPRTELAREAGLTIQEGICVDRYLQTSAPNVYALGDCAEMNGLVLPYVAPITYAAKALVKTLTGEPTQVTYPAMPIEVKTPACPLVVASPFAIENHQDTGEWEVTGTEQNLKALYYTAEKQLGGFVLTGNFINEKTTLTKQLPPLLA